LRPGNGSNVSRVAQGKAQEKSSAEVGRATTKLLSGLPDEKKWLCELDEAELSFTGIRRPDPDHSPLLATNVQTKLRVTVPASAEC